MSMGRAKKFIPLILVLVLLNIVTIIILQKVNPWYFIENQSEFVTKKANTAYFEIEESDVLLRNIYKHRQQLPAVSFIVEYYQNIPGHPINDVLVVWENTPNSVKFPLRTIKSAVKMSEPNRAYIGKKVWKGLSKDQQNLFEINNKVFPITAILGEKGVNSGRFDETILIFGEALDSEYLSRLPQKYSASLYILSEDTIVVEQFRKILKITDEAKYVKNLDVPFYLEEHTMKSTLFYRRIFMNMVISYIIVGITIFVLAYALHIRMRHEMLVMKALGATTSQLIARVLASSFMMYILSICITLVLQQLTIILDLPFLGKVQPEYLTILFVQTMLFLTAYSLLTINRVLKIQPALFLQTESRR